ncbi:MAG: N-acetyl-gamma-glutamyl-phosphate reductase [Alphaproteobacteria bacterium]
MSKKIKVGILGASGYTGADLVRLLSVHPNTEITVLTAGSNAGKEYGDIYPHLSHLNLPKTTSNEDADFSKCDVVFCGLPHGHSQDLVKQIPTNVKVVDLSADFRIEDTKTYEQWYDRAHTATDVQAEAVYGLTEHARDNVKGARVVACPGCYPTATLLSLIPLAKNNIISGEDIIIDAKSGVSGAGRGVKQGTLFCELSEQMNPYGVASHRHAPEIEQELSKRFGSNVIVNFTPHLVPLNRGELVTIYVKRNDGVSHADLEKALIDTYKGEKFVRFIDGLPKTSMVKGSNLAVIGAKEDRIPNRSIVMCAIDNLVKGSSGQAIQNMNIMFELEETTGLEQQPNFP